MIWIFPHPIKKTTPLQHGSAFRQRHGNRNNVRTDSTSDFTIHERKVEKLMQGRISDWKDDRGFGFITPDEGGLPVFFHISALGPGARRPTIGEAVTFDASITPEGKVRADQVRRIGIAAATEVMMSRRWILSVLPLLFIGFLCIQAVRGIISPIVPMVYCGMSLLAFGFYGFDKMSAKRDMRRTEENTLHFLALLGGWPGALMAQQTFRHKSSKWSFQIVFWLTMIVNCGILWVLLIWVGSPAGRDLLRNVMPLK